jgi:hypothetical protein
MCKETESVKMLTLFGGLRCVGFINLTGVFAHVRR